MYGSTPFLGETQVRIVIGPGQISCHFFIVPDDAGAHEIILGMPFFRDTSLMFDFKDGRLVTSNATIGGKIVRAYVVSENTSRRAA